VRDGITEFNRPIARDFPWPNPKLPVGFFPCNRTYEEREGNSYRNRGEAEKVSWAVDKLKRAGFRTEEIGVIAGYSAQVRYLRKMLAGVEVSSVDGFQGREKEAIIISTVRCNSVGNVGFLKDWRRVNVMMTRAKSALIVIGNSATLANEKATWIHWLAWAGERGVIDGMKKSQSPYGTYEKKLVQKSGIKRLEEEAARMGSSISNEPNKEIAAVAQPRAQEAQYPNPPSSTTTVPQINTTTPATTTPSSNNYQTSHYYQYNSSGSYQQQQYQQQYQYQQYQYYHQQQLHQQPTATTTSATTTSAPQGGNYQVPRGYYPQPPPTTTTTVAYSVNTSHHHHQQHQQALYQGSDRKYKAAPTTTSTGYDGKDGGGHRKRSRDDYDDRGGRSSSRRRDGGSRDGDDRSRRYSSSRSRDDYGSGGGKRYRNAY